MKQMLKAKRGFFGNLSALAIALVVFAVIIVVGSVVLTNLSNAVGAGTANTTGYYLLGQLGSTSGGLASWTPAIIAIAIGVLVIGAISSIGSKSN
jgi:hypothetical protein